MTSIRPPGGYRERKQEKKKARREALLLAAVIAPLVLIPLVFFVSLFWERGTDRDALVVWSGFGMIVLLGAFLGAIETRWPQFVLIGSGAFMLYVTWIVVPLRTDDIAVPVSFFPFFLHASEVGAMAVIAGIATWKSRSERA